MTVIDPFKSFRFRIEAQGLDRGGVQTVAGLERTTEVEPYREGGINDYEHQLAVMTKQSAITLKRGLLDVWFWDWHEDVVDGRIERKTISIILLDQTGEEAWRWVCVGAFPTKWSAGDLDAGANAVAVETVELVHHGLTRQ